MRLTPQKLRSLILETMNEFKMPAGMDFDFDEGLSSKQYGMAAFNTYNLMSDMSLNEEEEGTPEFDVYDPNNPNEQLLNEFFEGLSANPHAEFLSDWKIEDFRNQWLLLTKDKMTGVANTQEGHMGAGWNNGSNRGVLRTLMGYCMENLGGVSGDHFDGGLSGYYRSIGLTKIYEMYTFDPDLAPSKWKYQPVDIFNPKLSAYATALKEEGIDEGNIQQNKEEITIMTEGFRKTFSPYEASVRYSNGMPDVIFRRIG